MGQFPLPLSELAVPLWWLCTYLHLVPSVLLSQSRAHIRENIVLPMGPLVCEGLGASHGCAMDPVLSHSTSAGCVFSLHTGAGSTLIPLLLSTALVSVPCLLWEIFCPYFLSQCAPTLCYVFLIQAAALWFHIIPCNFNPFKKMIICICDYARCVKWKRAYGKHRSMYRGLHVWRLEDSF